MKRRFIFDARMIHPKRMHGIARYAYNLLLSLDKLGSEHTFYVLCHSDSPLFEVKWKSHFELVTVKSKWIGFGEHFELPMVFKKINADLFHTPSYVAPFFHPTKMIMTIHDLNHLVLPQYYTPLHQLYYKIIVQPSIKKSSFVLTVSEFSKREIIRTLSLNPKKIFVTYNGVSAHFHPETDAEYLSYIREIYSLPKEFIFCVSNNKPHKNLMTLVTAYCQSRVHIPLVIASAIMPEALAEAEKYGKMHLLIFAKYIEEAHLPAVYSLSKLFVYPSTYEGFGLPALEALACGVPVVVSRSSSLPEVVGDLAIFSDVTDSKALRSTLEHTLDHCELTDGARSLGPAYASRFSWDSMASLTLGVYEMACYDKEFALK